MDRLGDTPATASAVIVAGGTGERFGNQAGKQLARVGDMPLLAITVRAFMRASAISEIVLVCNPDRVPEYEGAVRASIQVDKPLIAVKGGATRQASVENGLDATGDASTEIIIHDGARPLIEPEMIDNVIVELRSTSELDGLVVGHPSYDTLKLVDGVRITGTPDRSLYWVAQTPQVFRKDVLRHAYSEAFRLGRAATDDASLVEAAGGKVDMYQGPRENIKVTVPEDLALIESVLAARGDI